MFVGVAVGSLVGHKDGDPEGFCVGAILGEAEGNIEILGK
jgi:hypothetical protein